MHALNYDIGITTAIFIFILLIVSIFIVVRFSKGRRAIEYIVDNSGSIIIVVCLWALCLGAIWLAIGSLSAIQVKAALAESHHEVAQIELASKLYDANIIKLNKDYALELDRSGNFAVRDVANFLRDNSNVVLIAEREMREADPTFNLIDDFKFFDEFSSFRRLLYMPVQGLLLILAVVMGALGSVVTMLWAFARREYRVTWRRFLVLPFVGALSALVVLIFFRAGQMTISGNEAQETLSPFFVSFVGIISGLVSERAYSWLSRVGEGVFPTDLDKPRWSMIDASTVDDAKIAKIARYLGLDPQATKEIVLGEKEAGQAAQQIIAASLDAEVRRIFTDIPPIK